MKGGRKMNNKLIFLGIALIGLFLLAGCSNRQENAREDKNVNTQTQDKTTTDTFTAYFGKGNAKCVSTDGKVKVTWWIKNEDFKVVAEDNSEITTIVKNGEFYYMQNKGQCFYYNIKELKQLAPSQQPQQTGTTEEIIEGYKGYSFSCTPSVVTASDVAPLKNCQDLTATLKQSIQQLCQICQQNPQQFGGNCEQYCK